MTTGILFQDGLDLYTQASDLSMTYLGALTGVTFSTTGGRFGGGGVSLSTLGVWINTGTQSDLWVSSAMSVTRVQPADYIVASWGTDHASNNGMENQVTFNPTTGVWKAWIGGYQITVAGSATKALTSGTHWIDAHCTRDASAGVIELWVDGVQILDVTGINTKAFASNNMIYAGWGDASGNGSIGATFDDLFITNATKGRLGDSRIDTKVPTSDATPNNGTPSTGTDHFACVDEAQFNTSDYITMPNTSGDKEVYGHGSIASTPAVVHSVRVVLVSQKTDAGAFSLEPLVVSGGTEGDGSSQPLSTSWGIQASIFETDPNTSAAWTYANANAADVGYKVP